MATTRLATQSLLGTVTSTANAVTGIVSTVADSVDILHTYVNRHKTMQADKNLIELHSYRTRLIRDTAREQTEAEEDIEKYLGNNEHRTTRFNAIHSEISKLFAPEPTQA
jgi:transcription termination factor NusB